MIEILVSSGYPVDQMACPFALPFTHVEPILGARRLNMRQRITPFQAVLNRNTESQYNEDTRLDILKCLLDQGSDVNEIFNSAQFGFASTSPISHCVNNESAAFVRLLLEYDADTSYRDSYGCCPMDYALIRQDKAVMQALVDHGCDRLTADRQPSADAAIESGVRQANLMGSIGHPMVAIVSARKTARKMEDLANSSRTTLSCDEDSHMS